MNFNIAPVILFVYNRLEHTIQTIEALKMNELSRYTKLYINSDGPKNSEDLQKVLGVRDYLRKVSGFKEIEVFESKLNKGLSRSIVEGVTKILSFNDRVIVLEDDLITSSYFLNFMNECLNYYHKDYSIGSISGYVYPIPYIPVDIFKVKGSDCWGWGTWDNRWRFYENDAKLLFNLIKLRKLMYSFNLNNTYNYMKMLDHSSKGKNDSWAIKWHASCFLNDLYTIYPKITFVNNIGFDGSGAHCGNLDYLNGEICKYKIIPNISSDKLEDGNKYFIKFFKKITFLFKIRLKLRSLFYKYIKYA